MSLKGKSQVKFVLTSPIPTVLPDKGQVLTQHLLKIVGKCHRHL